MGVTGGYGREAQGPGLGGRVGPVAEGILGWLGARGMVRAPMKGGAAHD